jgi:hypothetical protein
MLKITSTRSHNRKPVRWILPLAIVGALMLVVAPAYADVGPKPTMNFIFAYQIAPVAIVGGEQMECQDQACTTSHPLQELGPQRFVCQSGGCSSMAYGYSPYHKLVIQFADRTRESNIFKMSGFSGDFAVTVHAQDLSVRQTFTSTSIFDPVRVVLFFPIALVSTVLIELVVALVYLLVRKLPLQILLWVLVGNLLSVPVVWFVIPFLGLEPTPTTLLSELFAVVFEALFVYWLSRKRISLGGIAILSLLMNAASYLIGLLASIVFKLG